MRFCALCGYQPRDTDRFCIDCGAPVSSVGGHCSTYGGGIPAANPAVSSLAAAGDNGGSHAASAGSFDSLRGLSARDPYAYLYARPGQRTAGPEAGWQPGQVGDQPQRPATRSFPAALPEQPAAAVGLAGPREPARYAGSARPPRRRRAVAAALVLAAAAGAFGTMQLLSRHQSSAGTVIAAGSAGRPAAPVQRQQPGSKPAAGGLAGPRALRPAARQGPASAPPRARPVMVTIGPGAAVSNRARSVARFTARYFTAINQHDYPAYRLLLTPASRAALTPRAFQSGYSSTRDSAVTLAAVSVSRSGRITVTLTFASHQRPADSPAAAACTIWRIALELVVQRGTYLIAPPPPSYRASYRSCG